MLTAIAMELDAKSCSRPNTAVKPWEACQNEGSFSYEMLARDRGSAPKDLGIDLLVLKEKRGRTCGNMPENYIKQRIRKMAS